MESNNSQTTTEIKIEENLLEKVKNVLTENGIKFEMLNNMFGFKFPTKGRSEFVWHWFEYYEKHNWLMFNHSYSQNTGCTNKSLRHGMKVRTRLEKILGFQI